MNGFAFNSFNLPQCTNCFLKFQVPHPEDTGCRALLECPSPCAFHKTYDEQMASLAEADRINEMHGHVVRRKRVEDLRIF